MKKITSLFLVLCLLVSTVMINSPSMRTRAVAEDSTDYVEPLVSVDEITSYLTYDMVEDEGHVQRLYAEESLDTLVFRNRDGTKTTYFFAEDIKFTDDEGYVEVKDISLEYTSSTGYTTKMNDKSVVLPNNISSGVSVSYGENTVTMIPMPNPTLPDNIQANANAELVTGKNSVRYNSVFGSNTHIEYTPLMNGVKEDIILSSYDGTNMWVFMINTNGMAAYTDENGMHYFAASEASDTRFSLGNVFIYDSADNFSIGTMQIAAVRPNQQYMVAISADTEFLTDADTVYPIYIDPQITVSGTSSSNIQDTTVFSGSPSTNMGMWQIARVGCWGGDTSIARMLIKFPGLMNHSDFDEIINNSNALSVVLKLYQVEATDYAGIYIKVLKNSWTESNATWSNIDTDDTVGSKMIIGGGAAGYRTFDLTALFTNSSYSQYLSNGLVLKKRNETSDEGSYSFNTKECGSATSIPMVVATYANVDMSIIPDAISMCVGEERDLLEGVTMPTGQTLYDCSAGNYTNITVTSDRYVTANSAGNATLTVVIQDAETGLLAFKNVPVTIDFVMGLPDTVEILKGQAFSVSTSDDYNISWSSSDDTIADYETGGIFGKRAGTTTITAVATKNDGTQTVTYTCTVYVHIEDGVYYVQNKNSGLYLNVKDGLVADGTPVVQYSKYPNTENEVVRLRQMWKFKYLGSGRYSIRPMNKSDKVLKNTSGTSVVVEDLYYQDDTLDNIPSTAEWSLEENNNGYCIKNNALSSKTLQIQSASTQQSANVIVSTYSSSNNCRWNFVKINDDDVPAGAYWFDTNKSVVVVNPTRHVDINGTASPSSLNLMPIAYGPMTNDQIFGFASDNTAVATVNSMGNIAAHSAGNAIISFSVYRGGVFIYLKCYIYVGYPDFFNFLLDENLIGAGELDCTDDGFFLTTVSLSEILLRNGINQLPYRDKNNTTVYIDVATHYDDWYIYAVYNTSINALVPGLYKMRLEGSDNNVDEDTSPGVSISFIAFDVSSLFVYFSNRTVGNGTVLQDAIKRTVTSSNNTHNDVLDDYFQIDNNDGSYLIGEKYVSLIVNGAQNGIINIPSSFDTFYDKSRIIQDVGSLKNIQGMDILNDSTNTIQIQNVNSLTINERQVILSCFTGNSGFCSFAAEVKFHAEATSNIYSWFKYENAIISDMSIVTGERPAWQTPYYFVYDESVINQVSAHSDYAL